MTAFADYKEHAAALLKDPDNPVALVNQFVTLAKHSPRTAAHLALTTRAATLVPDQFEAVFNYASALNRAGMFWDALETFSRSLLLASEEHKADVLYNVGMCWHDIGELSRALEWYDKALHHAPDDLDIRQAHAVARLAQGKLAEGLFDFECRWHKDSGKPITRAGIPRWKGEDLTGKTLVVCHEQGFGDTLHFSRVIPLLKERAGTLIWSGPELLNGLMADNFAFDAVQDEHGPFTADYYCSPISAAGALGYSYAQVSDTPYFKSDAMQLAPRGKLKVGLSWRGSPGYARDADRSMPLEALCPLFEEPGMAFYSLQIRPKATEISNLGLDGFIADLSGSIRDWRDTARAVAAMNVIVSVDTANAHLAGALGKPVMLLLNYNSCWRWRQDGDRTPWYAGHKLFRQDEPNDWTRPVAKVREALRGFL